MQTIQKGMGVEEARKVKLDESVYFYEHHSYQVNANILGYYHPVFKDWVYIQCEIVQPIVFLPVNSLPFDLIVAT